jgi:hypothetical protein
MYFNETKIKAYHDEHEEMQRVHNEHDGAIMVFFRCGRRARRV